MTLQLRPFSQPLEIHPLALATDEAALKPALDAAFKDLPGPDARTLAAIRAAAREALPPTPPPAAE